MTDHERLLELIDRIATTRRAERRAAAAEHGVSLAQLDALGYLERCNRYSDTPAGVASYLEATRGTTSQTLLALEKKGLIARSADGADGRVRHLRPTRAGKSVLAATEPDELADALAGLQQLGPTVNVLEQALVKAQRQRGGKSFGTCATCRHLRGRVGEHECGLTGEPLSDQETTLICAEHGPTAS